MSISTPVIWTNMQKIAFRFIALYGTIFMLSNQFITSYVFDALWRKAVPWLAKNVLGLAKDITIFTNGSGDTTYNYTSLLWYVLLAVVGTIIWTLVDRRRDNYERALQFFVTFVRYYLVYQMLIYGLAKLTYTQFPFPRLERLTQTYGDSSPMGLMWTFMGYSKGYNLFTGGAEFLGALLLLFRRTTTLGALVTLGVMANVMALNFFYDVPVKILSTHMVFLSFFLLALDGRRLLNLFILNRPTQAVAQVELWCNKTYVLVKNSLKGVAIIGSIILAMVMTNRMAKQYGLHAKPPLYGSYKVKTFTKNDTLVPPQTDRWRRLLVTERKNSAALQFMDGYKARYTFQPDTTQQWILLKQSTDTLHMDTLRYTLPTPTAMRLQGVLEGDTLDVLLEKEAFELVQRGFNWVSERPHNR